MSVHVALSAAAVHSEEAPKKFRKTRDYFGKRRIHSIVAGENGTFGYDEDSNDSGVSTRDTGGAGGKGEPNSPSSASVTSGTSSESSHSSSQSDSALKQRAKVIRLGDKSIQGISERGPAASSTPFPAAKPLRQRVTPKPADMDDLQVNGQSLDQIKRTKWENDLKKIMKLLQNSKVKEEAPLPAKGSPINTPAHVHITSSKRRIIPKQKISV